MTTSPQTQTLTAANDNPGGATRVEMQLSSFVRLIARAYVAQAKERSA